MIQLKLLKVDKVLKLNISLERGITCLNIDDFTDEEVGKLSRFYHSGWFVGRDRVKDFDFDNPEKREELIQIKIEEFKRFYNCDNVELSYFSNPSADNTLGEQQGKLKL